MKINAILLASLLMLAGQLGAVERPSTSGTQTAAANQTTRIIVKLKPQISAMSGVSKTAAAATIVSNRTGLRATFHRSTALGSYVMKLDAPLSLQEAEAYAQKIQADPDVEYAEPDRLRFPMVASVPTDPLYLDQWHYADPLDGNAGAINLPLAWGITQGSSDVVVSVIDTGAINHADLKNRFINGDVALSGRDFINDAAMARDNDGRDNNPRDEGDWESGSSSSWHGTHVAGTIAAQSNNAYGVAGVDWNAKLLTARVLGKGGGWSSDINDAIVWSAGKTVDGVANPNRAHVINMSFGGSGKCSNDEQAAIDYAVSQGVTPVVAAGNENKNASNSSPANCKNVVTVAALTEKAARASFSNYGAVVDIAAPGVSVLSTLDSGKQKANNSNTYASYGGTSMATPHVAGVVSLMVGANSNLRDGTIPRAQVPALLEAKLKASARPFPTGTGRDCTAAQSCGAGILDAHRAVLAVNTPPTVNVGAPQSVAAGTTVALNAAASDDAFGGRITAYQWEQIAGEPVTLNAATTASPTFIAPSKLGELQFRVTVTDDTALTTSVDTFVNVTAGSGLPLLSVSKAGNGDGVISSTPAGIDCGTDCFNEYATDTTVTLTATPASGSTFTSWSGACTDTDTSCVVNMDASKTVTANFTSTVVTKHPLTVNKTGTGSGSVSSTPAGIDCGTDCTEDYNAGTSVTLTATPESGSTFTSWSGACTGTASTCTVSMAEMKSVGAAFTKTVIASTKLTVSKTGTGSGSVSSTPAGIDCGTDCTEAYEKGTSVTLTATPADGSTFTGWSGACKGKVTTCTVSMSKAQTVKAAFTVVPSNKLTVSKTGTGSGSVSSTPAGIDCGTDCTEAYEKGTSVTLTATPADGSTFTGWSGACKGKVTTCTVPMSKAQTVKAAFAKVVVIQHSLSVKLSGLGDGIVTSNPEGIKCDGFFNTKCSAKYAAGTSVTLTATPDADFDSTFVKWTGACSGTNPVCTLPMNAAKKVTAVFR